MHIGHRIKAVRTERGLSLPDLAKEAGISKGLLYHIENSETPPNPSLETLNKISQALKITLAMLLEKRGVKGKRILPERLEPELEEMIKALKKQNEPLSETALDALYLLQERSGGFKTVQQWRFLYDSICLALSERR